MRNYADQIRAYVKRPYCVLGTDGFGRSDTREKLREFFEVNRYYIAICALSALMEEGQLETKVVAEAIFEAIHRVRHQRVSDLREIAPGQLVARIEGPVDEQEIDALEKRLADEERAEAAARVALPTGTDPADAGDAGEDVETPEHHGLLTAHRLMLRDQMLVGETERHIRDEGVNAEWALSKTLQHLAETDPHQEHHGQESEADPEDRRHGAAEAEIGAGGQQQEIAGPGRDRHDEGEAGGRGAVVPGLVAPV